MRLRALTQREKVLIGGAALLLALGGLAASLFLPLLGHLRALQQEVIEGERVVSRLRELEAQEPALDRRLAELRAAAASEGLDPGASFGPAEALMLLQSVEETWGVSWERITFAAADKGVLAVKATGAGSYRAVSEFLQALGRFPRTTSMSLTSLGPAQKGVRFELEVGLQLNMVAPRAGPTAPPPAVRLRLPPLPSPAEGRENPFVAGQSP
ncbi:MAG: hypothetical protein AB1816_14395 [Bacillota bacterium]